METVTIEKEVDIFINPFLTIAPDTIQKAIDASISGLPLDNPQIVPWHNFAIVSEHQQGIRHTVWSEYTDSIENAAADFIFKHKKWEQILIWDVGAACLIDEADDIFLSIGLDQKCEATNILLSRSSIGIIFENLKKKFKKYEGGGVVLRYEMLFESSLKVVSTPKRTIWKTEWLQKALS